jgi:hypothetical protein
MTPLPEQFAEWWSKHEHAEAITATEAWLCKRYREAWEASRLKDNTPATEQWWQR